MHTRALCLQFGCDSPRCHQIGFNDRQQLTRLTDLVEITSRSAITLLTLIGLIIR